MIKKKIWFLTQKFFSCFHYKIEKIDKRSHALKQKPVASRRNENLSLMMQVIIKKKILHVLRQFFLRFGCKIEKREQHLEPIWPKSSVCQVDDKFLLLLTPPNSGSTAISRFICQSNKIYGLVHRCQGLNFLFKFWGHKVRCAPHSYINYQSLAGILAKKVNKLKQTYPKTEYVFERTPDNACRYRSLLKIMPNTIVVANNRNPYAQIASAHKRRYILMRYKNPQDSLEECRMHTHYWLVWSEYIRDACEKDNIPLVTYEQFCDNPYAMTSAFGLEDNEFKKDLQLSDVKDYAPQTIENMNEKQIALLSDAQKKMITEALSEHKELLAYFGYELMQ